MLQLHKWFGWISLFSFLVLCFPGWYRLSYTKIWELKRMFAQERLVQLQVLHPADQMGQLVALKIFLQQNFAQQKVYVFITEPSTLALSQNPVMTRGVLQDSLQYKLAILPESALRSDTEAPCIILGSSSLPEHNFPAQCLYWSGK